MAPRLPTPGGDDGTWGSVLNDFLAQVHKTDGSLKDNSVTSAALAPNAVTAGGIQDAIVSEAKLDAALQAKVNGLGGGGSLTLAGDVTGLSTATVVAKVNGVAVSGTPSAGQVLKATSSSAASWQADATGSGAVTSVAGRTGAVTLDQSDIANLTADLAGKASTSHTHAAGDITSGTVAAARLGSGTANGTTYLRGDGTWATPSGGSGDATSVNGVTVTGTPSAGQVLKATSTSAATWQADATGGAGGFSFSPVSITADHTASNNDAILADATSGAITITLPTPVLNGSVWVKAMDNSANSIQVVAPGASYIDDATVGSVTVNVQYNSVVFWSDGTNWFRW